MIYKCVCVWLVLLFLICDDVRMLKQLLVLIFLSQFVQNINSMCKHDSSTSIQNDTFLQIHFVECDLFLINSYVMLFFLG